MLDKPTYEELLQKYENLEKQSEFYKIIADNSYDWEMLISNSGKLLYNSPSIVNITGYSENEFYKNNDLFLEIVHPSDKEFVTDYYRNCKIEIEKDNHNVFRIISKDGSIKWIDQYCRRAIDKNGDLIGYRFSNRDITRDKEAEIKLKETINQLFEERKLFKQGNVVIFKWKNEENWPVEFVSSNVYDFLGYTPDELKSPNFHYSDLIHPDDIARIRSEIKTNHDKDIDNFKLEPYRLTCKDGRIIWVSEYTILLRDKKREITSNLGYIVDITEGRQAMEELIIAKEKAEENFNLLLNVTDNLPANIAVVDVLTLHYKFVNNKFTKSFNKKREEIVGCHISEIIGDSNTEFAMKYINDVRQGKPSSYTNAFDLAVGKRYINVNYAPGFNENGEVKDIIVLSQDITPLIESEEQLKKAKERAEESEEKYKSMVSILPDGVVIHQDGKIVYANPVAGKIMKAKQHVDLLGTNAIDFVHPDYKEVALERIKTSLLEKTPANPVDEVFIDFDGNPVYVYVTAVPFQFEGKMSMLTLFTDISELKRIEKELIKAKEKAEESDMLKTAFLQNMSHEIRTPMNAIIGFSSIIENPGLSPEKHKSYTSIIVNSTHQLLAIVTDILTISSIDTKQEKVNINKVSINSIIVDLQAIFKPQALNQNLSLYAKQALPDIESEIFTDGTKITQILTSLITNALKFTHEGFIEFGYEIKYKQSTDSDNDDTVDNSSLLFYVKDSGIGIEPEQQSNIFERFRQADLSITKKYGGTGLGLAISKAFVELLGGEIWVESELAKGSIFYFTVPYKQVHKLEMQNQTAKQNGSKITILVAEDEQYNYLLIEELLLKKNIELIHTKDGKETVEICKKNAEISLILMDIKMPIMNGFEAAKLIKEIRPDLPIIAQSAYALENEIKKYTAIFNDYITKPIDIKTFEQILNKYIDIGRMSTNK